MQAILMIFTSNFKTIGLNIIWFLDESCLKYTDYKMNSENVICFIDVKRNKVLHFELTRPISVVSTLLNL